MKLETTSGSKKGGKVSLRAINRAADVRPKELLTVRADEEGIDMQTRRQVIIDAQATIERFTKGRTGLVKEFLLERRESRVIDRA